MKDVISVDSLLSELYSEGIHNIDGKRGKDWSISVTAKALHSLLISKLPETVDESDNTNRSQQYKRIGYNSAIDDMRKSIDELLEVK